jgi:RNA polymerase sigma-70 factor, ECF subfamily
VTGQAPEVLEQLRRRIVAFAASRALREVAEDIAQETLLLLTTKYAHVTALEDLVPLSVTVARFKIRGHVRKAHRRGEHTAVPVEDVPLADETADPLTQVEQREAVERLKHAIRRLDGRCRDIYRLKLAGLGFAEIRDRLGASSVNTVYTWEFRCRRRLRVLLGGSPVPEVAA